MTYVYNETLNISSGPAPFAFLKLFEGKILAAAVGAAASLNLAEHLADSPKTLSELAEASKSQPEQLFRLLRLLISNGLFHLREDGKYELNEDAKLLVESHPRSIKPSALWMSAEINWRPWSKLDETVRTGKGSIELTYNQTVWQYFQDKTDPDSEESFARFNAAMTSNYRFEGDFITSFDFSRYKKIADIGGGHGKLLVQILNSHPAVEKAVLFDLAHVLEAKPKGEDEELIKAGRLELSGGSFLEKVPSGLDAYILKHIIHDWPDKDCVTILKNIRSAMKEGSHVIVVDVVIVNDSKPSFGKFLDLQMMVCFGTAKERTEEEFRELFKEAGFRLTSVVTNHNGLGIIVGEAAP